MSSSDLDNLVRAGLLKREAADQKEFEALLDSGRRRLSDSKLGGLSAESQLLAELLTNTGLIGNAVEELGPVRTKR